MRRDDEVVLLERPRRSFYQKHERLIVGGTAVLVAIALWEALWESGRISPLFFTGPSSVVKRFVEEWTQGRLKQDMAYSGANFAIGVGLAIVSGVVIGRDHRVVPAPRDGLRAVPDRACIRRRASRSCRWS